jgi:transposase
MSYYFGYVELKLYIYLIMRYIKLKTEEIEALDRILKNSTNNTIRKRSQCLLLSNQKRKITDLSTIFNVNRRTIERWFDKWDIEGVNSLPIMNGRGVKTRLKGFEKEVSEQLELHSRNLKNVLLYFEKQHNLRLCKKTLQNFLKDTGL